MKRLFYSLLLSTAVLSITSCGEKQTKVILRLTLCAMLLVQIWLR